MEDVLAELYAVIQERKETQPEESYTASLLTHEKGEDAALEKLGEETTELLLAVKNEDDDEIVHEAADIVYHLLVVLAMTDVELETVRAELERRRG